VRYLANQASLFANIPIAGLLNEFILTHEYSDHSVLNGNYTAANTGQPNCITGTGTVRNAYCFTNAAMQDIGSPNLLGRTVVKAGPKHDWQVTSNGLSLMDTVDLTENLTLFAGVRADWFDFKLDTITAAGVRTPYGYSDTLTNYHAGLVWQITPEINVYASYGTSQDINGGESDVGTSSAYGGAIIFNSSIAGARPETSETFEIGTKWNLFDDRFLATAALFQSTKRDIMEGDAGYAATGTFNTGANRVSGVELEVVGMLTEDLTIQGGLSYMSAEVIKSATVASLGRTLFNFANFSASAQAKYRLTEALSVGVIGQYVSKRYGGQPDRAAAYAGGLYSQPSPAYAVMDLFATYKYDANLAFRLNVGNVFDRDYYMAAYQGGFFLYKGDARNFRFGIDYEL
jgi:catecholate siderophore receptor